MALPLIKNYLYPRHIVLLHFFHLLLDGGIQLVLQTQRLTVVYVSIVVEKITL